MKKIVLTVALALANLAVNAQIGVVTVDKNAKETPLGFWYVVNGKGFENQMFFQDETTNTLIKLESILCSYDLNMDVPKGKDEEGDPYWIVMDETERVTYIYLIENKFDKKYSTITLLTK
jgi:hypothetical protein